MFQLEASWPPAGDQPQAIKKLVEGVEAGKASQVLLGITGSGKTFTMANVIQAVQQPTLILAHNKTLAAQLYQEFAAFFPHNAVEYFVSYYDYYQPEAYIARTDTYIEKDMAINERIDKMRLSATRSLLERRDVIIISSVSCIYGLGSPDFFHGMNLTLTVGSEPRRDDLLLHLVEMQYKRNDYDFSRATFRVRGDVLEIFPSYEEDLAIRVEFFGDEIERISEIDPLTGKVLKRLDEVTVYPGSHHVTPEEVRVRARETIRQELKERSNDYEQQGRLLEKQRIQQRTLYDLEMIREIGFCKGIENYSRHFSGRKPGEPPPCLLDYFADDFLTFIDESHQTVPQLRAMYNGDRARKESLVDFGFRLPSAFDNRPMKFEETMARLGQVIYVSATPAEFEIHEAGGAVVEQIIRPTALLDPEIELRPAANQVDDVLGEIGRAVEAGGAVLVTTLTKKLAEDLTQYLEELDVRARYLHSDVNTLERMQIIQELRERKFDVLVGINLLREGLDIPEVTLVAILDADREGFLRSETSLIQTCGRASRNAEGRVIMYADKETPAIRHCIALTAKRRQRQLEHNEKNGLVPRTVSREIVQLIDEVPHSPKEDGQEVKQLSDDQQHMTVEEVREKITHYQKLMRQAAKDLQFEEAARYRDLMRYYEEIDVSYS